MASTALKPEKSHNYGAGVVLKPTSALTMTIDGYIINVKDRIGISQTYHVTAADILAQPELAAVGEGGDVNFFTNAFDTSTKGIDFVGTWRHDIFDGNLTATLAYNYNKSKVTKFDPAVISDGPENRRRSPRAEPSRDALGQFRSRSVDAQRARELLQLVARRKRLSGPEVRRQVHHRRSTSATRSCSTSR